MQIFIAKLGFSAGALVLPFQIALFISAIVTLSVLLLPRYGAEFFELLKNNPALFWKLFFANAVQSGLGTSLSIIGVSLTSAINAGFLVKLSTVTTSIFAWIILKEQMSVKKVFVIFIALSGAYLITTKGQTLFPHIGDLFLLGACFCWSLGNVYVRKFLKSQSVKADVVTIQKPIAGLPVLLVLVGGSILYMQEAGKLSMVLACCSFKPDILPYALGSGFFLALAWVFLYRTLEVATASYMTLMSMVTPIFVSLLAVTILKESMVGIQVLGGGMILLSGVLGSFGDLFQK